MARLVVSDRLSLDERDLVERFLRTQGPGGQNVNKVASAVELRFDLAGNLDLPGEVKARLAKLAGRRLSQSGVLVILASEHRTQERNRQAARQRLLALIRRALPRPKTRRPTKPSKTSKEKRVAGKKRRSDVKQARRRPSDDA